MGTKLVAVLALVPAIIRASVTNQLFYICVTKPNGDLKKVAITLAQWERDFKCGSTVPPSECPNWLYSIKDTCGDHIDNDCNGFVDDGEACVENNVAELCDDPWLVGLWNQRYEFHGKDNVWYAAIADDRLQLNARMAKYGTETFVNGMSLHLAGAHDGASTSLVIKVRDPASFAPMCTLPKGEVCIAEGALDVEVDGRKIAQPGVYDLADEESTVHIFNAPWECKAKPDAHFHWDAFHNSRRLRDHLNVHEEILYPHSNHKELFDDDACADWVENRYTLQDIYQQAGPHTTVLINTPDIELRLEYYLNTDPQWVMHHRFDFFISNYKVAEAEPELVLVPIKKAGKAGKSGGEIAGQSSNSISNVSGDNGVSGILGDSATLKVDADGHVVMSDRLRVLDSPKDEDYEVDGAFGIDFGARKRGIHGAH